MAKKIIYWIATLWLALGMVSTGIVQLLKLQDKGNTTAPGGLTSMMHLGYPVYILPLLGVLKLLGVVTILIPKAPLLKEWAYAGFFFLMIGAIFSHLEVGDPVKEIFPALGLLILAMISWYLRPAGRKIASVGQDH